MFADTMKQLRRSRKMTQAQLGKLLGLSASAIGMYEQGRREPDLSVILQLCQIFNVPADLLLNDAPPPEQSLEIKDVLQDIQDRLLSTGELTLDGTPMSFDDIQRLIHAIEVSTAVVLNQVEREHPSTDDKISL